MPRRGRTWALPELQTVPSLTGQLAEMREALNRARDALRDAEERAALAQESAKDAWRFAKALSGAGRTK
jgi:hypothetical protein